MQKFVLALGCCLLAAAPLAASRNAFAQQASAPADTAAKSDVKPPDHPITPEQVHQMMELTGAVNLKNQMMRNMMAYMQQTLPPYIPKGVVDDLEATLEKLDFEPMMLKSYQKVLSTEDATQIIAFYKTPAGQRLIIALPQVTREVQQQAGQMGGQAAMEVMQRHKDEIEAAEKKYQQEHPAQNTVVPNASAPN